METLTDEQIDERLGTAGLTAWSHAGPTLVRDHQVGDFPAAIALVNAVAAAAEELDHHPDILVHGWNKVRLTLSTHSVGGLTEADFALAGRIEALLR
ncbi:MAG: 4a-hydroxytetrahydrobiopterin dehydratase [Solirubrobacteraceae bacterium]|jgi:4a-hydroxytetrahydrobiopterin dehydratase|nr:4a-hydroxytetrahydrobiopterin dehydratase [Solirubrobacteraceae bacterium]MEA2355003.1 4a-hydroxytetrahydrobiopterin dehydratase [Solirubrobacteraceae bacterium]